MTKRVKFGAGGETTKEKEGAKYKAEVNYPYGRTKPRMEILRDNVAMRKPVFDMEDAGDERTRKKAEEYASEMQRETRGKKAGGKVKKLASGGFPDLNDDGKVTRADVLKGRGVPGFKSGKWIQSAIKKPGALRKELGVKGDKPIPAGKLAKAAKAPGKLGQRARLAQTLKKMK